MRPDITCTFVVKAGNGLGNILANMYPTKKNPIVALSVIFRSIHALQYNINST